MENKKNDKYRLILIAVWGAFTVSLTVWWLIFGLRQLDLMQLILEGNVSREIGNQFVQKHKMLISEGLVLLFSLGLGIAGLTYFVFRERATNRSLKEFFAAFSHDIKTSLASLRLQAEALQEDLGEGSSPLLGRLVKDTVRLELQLENSLYLANIDSAKLFIEEVDLNRILKTLRNHWPEIVFKVTPNVYFKGDQRALESVFKNLVHNAITHGSAKNISIVVQKNTDLTVNLEILNDGTIFKGDLNRLGQLFERQSDQSGSGVGLYIVRRLSQKMGGDIYFDTSKQGSLTVGLELAGGIR